MPNVRGKCSDVTAAARTKDFVGRGGWYDCMAVDSAPLGGFVWCCFGSIVGTSNCIDTSLSLGVHLFISIFQFYVFVFVFFIFLGFCFSRSVIQGKERPGQKQRYEKWVI